MPKIAVMSVSHMLAHYHHETLVFRMIGRREGSRCLCIQRHPRPYLFMWTIIPKHESLRTTFTKRRQQRADPLNGAVNGWLLRRSVTTSQLPGVIDAEVSCKKLQKNPKKNGSSMAVRVSHSTPCRYVASMAWLRICCSAAATEQRSTRATAAFGRSD